MRPPLAWYSHEERTMMCSCMVSRTMASPARLDLP